MVAAIVGLALLILGGCGGSSPSEPASTTPAGAKVPRQVGKPAEEALSLLRALVQTEVPRLVGKSTGEARSLLRARALHAQFTFLGSFGKPCPALPSSGKIVLQEPQPGRVANRGGTIRLQTECLPASQLPQCPPGDLHLSAAAADPINGGHYHIGAEIKHFRGPPCALAGPFTLSVETEAGAPITSIRGNPLVHDLHAALGLGETAYVSVDSSGWPTARQKPSVVVVAEFDGLTSNVRSDPPDPEAGLVSRMSLTSLDRADTGHSYVAALARTRR